MSDKRSWTSENCQRNGSRWNFRYHRTRTFDVTFAPLQMRNTSNLLWISICVRVRVGHKQDENQKVLQKSGQLPGNEASHPHIVCNGMSGKASFIWLSCVVLFYRFPSSTCVGIGQVSISLKLFSVYVVAPSDVPCPPFLCRCWLRL